jgi:hypothetical protein
MHVDQAVEERCALDPGQGRLQQRINRDRGDQTAVDGQHLHHALSGGSETVARFPHHARDHILRAQGGSLRSCVVQGTFGYCVLLSVTKKVKFLETINGHLK